MSGHDEAEIFPGPRPGTNDRDAWLSYWREQGQSWRTEPEIDHERQGGSGSLSGRSPWKWTTSLPFQRYLLDACWYWVAPGNARGRRWTSQLPV